MSDRPNILYIMCDELRWCDVGCYGHPTVRTPHLDALAERGCRFETAVSNSPLCGPARSVVLSGQYARTCRGTLDNAQWPNGHGLNLFPFAGFPQWPTGRRVDFDDPTLPETLRDAGYATAAIGKWHVEAWPDALGFDHYVIPAHHHAHTAQWFIEDGGPPFCAPGFSVDFEADRVTRWIANRPTGEPWFMYYNLSPPHMPLADAPERYLEMYGRDDVVVRGNVVPEAEIEGFRQKLLSYLWDYRYYRDHLPHTTAERWASMDLIDLHRLYLGLITWVDDTVGRVLGALDAAGLTGDTLVVFTSDHGDMLGSWGMMGKAHWRDEAARVPMIVAGPGVRRGVVTGHVGSLVDVAPTLLGLAGLDDAAGAGHLQGRDLSGLVKGGDAGADGGVATHTFIECLRLGVAVRTPTHVLGRRFAGGHRLAGEVDECFDMTADPLSLHDLTGGGGEGAAAIEALSELVTGFDRRTPWRGGDPAV